MSVTRTLLFFIALALIATLALLVDGVALFAQTAPQQPPPQQQPQSQAQVAEGFRFKSSIELINVSASVFDNAERFVPNLHKEDFILYEDDKLQPISQFSADRVPVSLGILLDISGSMEGEKFRHATDAIERFVKDILVTKDDEVFLYTFNDYPRMVQGWTNDRDLLMRQLRKQYPAGGTAMNDTVAEAIPYAQRGHNPKKAIVIISDGNDNKSATQVTELRSLIRETEVLLYAIGIDGAAEHHNSRGGGRGGWPGTPGTPGTGGPGGRRWPQQSPSTQFFSPQIIRWPGPTGGQRPPSPGTPRWPKPDPKDPQQPTSPRQGHPPGMDEGVNSHALRELTDDSGGRTEIVKDGTDLAPATNSIADELSRQYALAYEPAAKKDGRWHTIRVESVNRDYRVRARRGYMATP
jgi:VWFA-related protein